MVTDLPQPRVELPDLWNGSGTGKVAGVQKNVSGRDGLQLINQSY